MLTLFEWCRSLLYTARQRKLEDLQRDVTLARVSLNKAERKLQEYLTREAQYRATLSTWNASHRLHK